jgi:ATP-binding cassette subfamily B (MDR/TAP) protein 1
VLVFEGIKRHRRNMTTIVITHDLSQVEDDDFLYMLKHGCLVQQGFRHHLEADPTSTFRDMADSQGTLSGFPVRDLDADAAPALDTLLVEPACGVSRLSLYPGGNNRLTFNNWMLDAVNDLSPRPTQSRFISIEAFAHDKEEARLPETPRRRLSFDMPSPTAQAFRVPRRRLSLQFVPKSPAATHSQGFDVEAAPAREARPRRRHEKKPVATEIVVETPATTAQSALRTQIGFWRLMMNVYPPVQCKLLVCLGLFFCLASGAMTPIFSYLLSRVMSEVSIGAKHSSTINWYGAAVLFTAAADGAFMDLKFLIMEKAAMRWVTDVRKRCLERVLAQDKK